VSSMNKPLNDAELSAHEAQRDLAAELLQSVKEMKAGQVQVVSSPIVEAPVLLGMGVGQKRFE
jgi:putative transcriptional regulator